MRGPALWATESETGDGGDDDNEWESGNAKSKPKAGRTVGATAPLAPSVTFPPPSVTRTARGIRRPRAHRGSRQPEILSRTAYVLVNRGGSGGRDGLKNRRLSLRRFEPNTFDATPST